jgi:two-component system, cell cycle sensor histidine kinase and response regulator CckA
MKKSLPRLLVIDDNPAIHEDFNKIFASPETRETEDLSATEMLLFGAPSSGAFPTPAPPEIGFEMSHALQGQEGLALVEQAVSQGHPYAVAFVDMRMPPGWDGLETAERIFKVDSNIQIVICTAYSDYSWDEIRKRLCRPDGLLILKKPFDVVEVLQIAHNLTRKWELSREIAAFIAEQDGRVEERTRELNSSRERFVTMFKSAPLAQMIVDSRGPDGLEVNEAFCRLTGCGEEIWKNRTSAIEAVSLTGLGEIMDWDHPIQSAEATIRDRSWSKRHVLVSSVVLGFEGSPSLLLMMQDVTERRRLESDVRQIQKLDAVGQLAAGVAHDFNNLLTVISGNAELVHQANTRGEIGDLRLIEEILDSSARASVLTRRLLAFTRRQVFQPRHLSLNRLLEAQIALLSRLLGEHIEIIWSPGGEDLVYADAPSIEQIVLNLAINARDAMPEGGQISIGTGLTQINSPEEALRLGIDSITLPLPNSTTTRYPCQYVTLTVSDTGTGMSPEIAERVFEPFFTTKEIGKGTGLGLPSVYGTVKRHQGAITLHTVPGQGTRFQVLLPLALGAAETPEPTRHWERTGSRGGGASADQPLNILVVEDEPSVRRVALRLLESLGHHPIEALDGHSGLAKWREHRDQIDLVITDMVMPGGMNGLQLADRIQADRPDMPVILASGYSNEMFRDDEIVLAPLKGFLPKPYDQESLREAIGKVPLSVHSAVPVVLAN